jgi:hypothetical protein
MIKNYLVTSRCLLKSGFIKFLYRDVEDNFKVISKQKWSSNQKYRGTWLQEHNANRSTAEECGAALQKTGRTGFTRKGKRKKRMPTEARQECGAALQKTGQGFRRGKKRKYH